MKATKVFSLILLFVLLLSGCGLEDNKPTVSEPQTQSQGETAEQKEIPEFDGETPYVVLNENIPEFSEEDLTDKSFESYSPLDSLGRCGVVIASIGRDIMPTEDREGIGQIKPSGWHTVKYDNVEGKYLYNRCHLIGFQLTGENANERNLITGTRYLNIEGMLPFENMVADYVKETGNHVLYRVTPIYEGNNLLASGVKMEAKSVEDKGEGICFNIYAYNAQPGIKINYENGESALSSPSTEDKKEGNYVLNTNSKKIHLPSCESAKDISEKNKKVTTETKEELIKKGYSSCKACKP